MTTPEQRIHSLVGRIAKPRSFQKAQMQSPDAIELVLDCRAALQEIRDGKWPWRPRETGGFIRVGSPRRPAPLLPASSIMDNPSWMELIDDLRGAVEALNKDSVKRGEIISLAKCHCEGNHKRWWRWWR